MILIIAIRSIKYTWRICLLGNSFELTVVMFERAASNSLLFIDFLGEPSGKVSDGGEGDRGYVMAFSKLTATFVLCVTVNNLPRMSLCEAICFSCLFFFDSYFRLCLVMANFKFFDRWKKSISESPERRLTKSFFNSIPFSFMDNKLMAIDSSTGEAETKWYNWSFSSSKLNGLRK